MVVFFFMEFYKKELQENDHDMTLNLELNPVLRMPSINIAL